MNKVYRMDGTKSEADKHLFASQHSEATSERDEKLSQIGTIWNNIKKMRKKNKSYERNTVRRLNGIIKKLNRMGENVTEELFYGKRNEQDLREEGAKLREK